MKESGENYLETILILTRKNGAVRAIDVANHLSYAKASVSRAVSVLKGYGYITVEPGGNIILTEDGMKKACDILDRHIAITNYLEQTLGISYDRAAADACRIEHIISDETYSAIKVHYGKEIKKGTKLV